MKTPIRLLIAACLVLAAAGVAGQVPVPEPAPIAIAFHRNIFWLWLVQQVTTLALPLYLLISGRASSIAKLCDRLAGNRWIVAAAIFAATYAFSHWLLQLPGGFLRAFRLAPYFGLPVPQVWSWILNQLSPMLSLVGIALVVGWIPFWLIRKSPKWWWMWTSAALVVLATTYWAARPLLVDPSTTTYVPLTASDHSSWQPRIDGLAARAGVGELPVVVWETRPSDLCRLTNSVIGLGPTRTVVLADQIFTSWEPEQVDVAVAHELKHYLFDNTWLPVLLIAILGIGGGLSVHFFGRLACRRWSHRFGFDSLAQPAALPLMLAIAQLYMLVAIPAFNLTAQRVELEADRFALELTRENDARARVSADQCGRLWLSEDTLFDRLYRNTHPSVARRINLANSYRPWETGAPLVYGDTILSE
jgi:STE24 endopeptidase